MPRPCCPRQVGNHPRTTFFKPAGIPCRQLETIVLALDEAEALRLADLEGLYQEEAAARMNISRTTFARIVEAARRKTAEAIIHGKALRLEDGPVAMARAPAPKCRKILPKTGCGGRQPRGPLP